MTTGSYTDDRRIWYTSNCGAPNGSWKGWYAQKSWGGGDRYPGEVPGTPHNYSMTRTIQRQLPFLYRWKNDPVGQYVTGSWLACGYYPGVPGLSWSADQEYKILGKLKRKIQGGTFNLAIMLGEGHQTLSMIANTAYRIGGAYTLLKKGNVKGAAKVFFTTQKQLNRALQRTSLKKDTAGNWLALQYGWLPLLSDVEEAAKMLSARLSVPASQSFRVSRKIGVDGQLYLGSPPYVTLRFAENWRRMKKQIIYTATEDWGGMTIPQILGLTDPEILAWELLPFSFVADWFIPIGNWLEARAFAQKIKGQFVVSLKDEWQWKGLRSGDGPGNYIQITDPAAALNSSGGVTFTRTVSTTYASVPKPDVHGLGEAVSWRRAANAIALLVGQHGSLQRWANKKFPGGPTD